MPFCSLSAGCFLHAVLSLHAQHSEQSCRADQLHLQQVALVHHCGLALLKLSTQTPQLSLVLAQQRGLVHILVHAGHILNTLGTAGELQGAQRLCTTAALSAVSWSDADVSSG